MTLRTVFLLLATYFFVGNSFVSAQNPPPTPPASSTTGQTFPSPTPIPAATPVLGTPNIQYKTVYRKVTKTGILAANGAEIVLPSVPNPMLRSVSAQNGHLDVIDTAANGTMSTTSWDISVLTNPYLPTGTLGGSGPSTNYVNAQNGDTNGNANATYAPDLLPGETAFSITVYQSSGSSPNNANMSNAQSSQKMVPVMVPLGSVFADDANRIFFTPPVAAILLPLPVGVFEIDCVTHLAMNGIIVVEWWKVGEDDFHSVGINTTTLSTSFDYLTDDTLNAHDELTWIDGADLLGKYRGHGFEAYSTINVNLGTVTAKTNTSNNQVMKVYNSSITTYNLPTQ